MIANSDVSLAQEIDRLKRDQAKVKYLPQRWYNEYIADLKSGNQITRRAYTESIRIAKKLARLNKRNEYKCARGLITEKQYVDMHHRIITWFKTRNASNNLRLARSRVPLARRNGLRTWQRSVYHVTNQRYPQSKGQRFLARLAKLYKKQAAIAYNNADIVWKYWAQANNKNNSDVWAGRITSQQHQSNKIRLLYKKRSAYGKNRVRDYRVTKALVRTQARFYISWKTHLLKVRAWTPEFFRANVKCYMIDVELQLWTTKQTFLYHMIHYDTQYGMNTKYNLSRGRSNVTQAMRNAMLAEHNTK